MLVETTVATTAAAAAAVVTAAAALITITKRRHAVASGYETLAQPHGPGAAAAAAAGWRQRNRPRRADERREPKPATGFQRKRRPTNSVGRRAVKQPPLQRAGRAIATSAFPRLSAAEPVAAPSESKEEGQEGQLPLGGRERGQPAPYRGGAGAAVPPLPSFNTESE
ncbi:unnamed protein product [Lampetra planeri]